MKFAFLSLKRTAWLGAALLLAAGMANAASVLNFPRLSAQPGTFTGVAIVNPSLDQAEVRLTAYGLDGRELAIADLTIPAGQQRGELTENLFSGLDPDAVGWFQAVSDAEGLTGFFLFLNGALSELDGADLPITARSVVFSQIQAGDGFATELNLVNPNADAVSIRLRLLGNGAEVERRILLAGRGAVRLDAADLFGISEAAEGAFAVAESPADILGFELVRLAGGDVQGLNARPLPERLNTLYFPQFAVGSGIRTELGLTNLSRETVVAAIAAHRPDGSLYGGGEVGQNPVTRELAAGQSIREDLAEAFGFSAGAEREGWLEATSESTALSGRITYRIPGAGAAAAVTATSRGAKKAIFSHIATTQGFFTGIAGLNPGALPADVGIVASNAAGQILGRFDMTLRPGSRFSRLLSDLIAGAEGQNGGFVFVRSNVPLFLTSLFGTAEGSALANIPPQPAPAGYRPDPDSPLLRVSPALTSLQPGGMQLFETGEGSVVWGVDGENGSGAIDESGLYQAPAGFPDASPVVVTAQSGDLAAAAAVDFLPNAQLAQTGGPVQSLAYLGGSQRFYTVEITAGQQPVGSSNGPSSAVVEILPTGERRPVADFPGETISKMISFESRNGVESLLLAVAESGRILRLDPISGGALEVAAGLNFPTSMVLDPVSRNLLVTQGEQVISIARSQLEAGAPEAVPSRKDGRAPMLIPAPTAAGVAVDQCSGNLLFSDPDGGRILEYARADGSVRAVAEGLARPSQLTALYRKGVACPDALHLAVVQEAPEPIALVVPHLNLIVSPWIPVQANDAAFLPAANPFSADPSLVVAQGSDSAGSIHRIDVSDVYAASPPNAAFAAQEAAVSDPGPDLAIVSATAQPGGGVSLDVLFRPGPPDGPDRIGAIVLSIDYDESRLLFDSSDANLDGLPDAILSGLPEGYTLRVFFDPDDTDGEIDVVAADLTAPLRPIPAGSLLNVTFGVREGATGTADARFSASPAPSLADLSAARRDLSETVSGTVTILP